MIKLLIGGSPCTFWSIAQKNGRETEAEGMGWELFKNYLIAKEKFKPDFFLYENNKSAAQPIKDQISKELGVPLMHINSALVSAQNRQRFYAFNWEVEQPEDRGIVLRDILESGNPYGTTGEKGYALTATYWKGQPREKVLTKAQRTMVAEPVGIGYRGRMEDGKWVKRYESNGEPKANALTTATTDSMVGETVCLRYERTEKAKELRKAYESGEIRHGFNELRVLSPRPDCKTNTLTTVTKDNMVAEPIRIGDIGSAEQPIYEVKNGLITIKDKQYPIKLADGHYIIRKLTPVECERLQTLPDGYTKAVSNTQRYKGLGNGWTAEVIIHILNGALKDVPRDEEIVVLSMYDGIGTGRYCLDKMGFTNVKYFAYEIDKYAKMVSASNYPDIIQLGDAFDVRHPDWTIGY